MRANPDSFKDMLRIRVVFDHLWTPRRCYVETADGQVLGELPATSVEMDAGVEEIARVKLGLHGITCTFEQMDSKGKVLVDALSEHEKGRHQWSRGIEGDQCAF